MKILGLMTGALILLAAACAPASQVDGAKCENGHVCLTIGQDDDGVIFQIENRTNEIVVLPEFTGLGGYTAAYEIVVESDAASDKGATKSAPLSIKDSTEIVRLRPDAWIGFSIPPAAVREAYDLPEGCQHVKGSYTLSGDRDAAIFSGAVQGSSARICL